jgi:hypothetical protein
MNKINETVSILRKYMGFNCACEVADEIDELYNLVEECIQFGNMDGMNGSCHYCKEDRPELFQACWDENSKNYKPKLPKDKIVENNTSTYTLIDEDINTWECSECKEWWTLIEGTPKDNYMNYCPKCGSKIDDIKIETLDELIDDID